ncbi:hypothetical protein LINPERPRIM_LOCUS30686 [Linum perenne]
MSKTTSRLLRAVIGRSSTTTLPIHFYHAQVLNSLGNLIGKTVKTDFNTQRAERGKFARVSIEIDLNEPLPRLCFLMALSKTLNTRICRPFALSVEESDMNPKVVLTFRMHPRSDHDLMRVGMNTPSQAVPIQLEAVVCGQPLTIFEGISLQPSSSTEMTTDRPSTSVKFHRQTNNQRKTNPNLKPAMIVARASSSRISKGAIKSKVLADAKAIRPPKPAPTATMVLDLIKLSVGGENIVMEKPIVEEMLVDIEVFPEGGECNAGVMLRTEGMLLDTHPKKKDPDWRLDLNRTTDV